MQATELRAAVELHVKELVLSSALSMRKCCDQVSHVHGVSAGTGRFFFCHMPSRKVQNVCPVF